MDCGYGFGTDCMIVHLWQWVSRPEEAWLYQRVGLFIMLLVFCQVKRNLSYLLEYHESSSHLQGHCHTVTTRQEREKLVQTQLRRMTSVCMSATITLRRVNARAHCNAVKVNYQFLYLLESVWSFQAA